MTDSLLSDLQGSVRRGVVRVKNLSTRWQRPEPALEPVLHAATPSLRGTCALPTVGRCRTDTGGSLLCLILCRRTTCITGPRIRTRPGKTPPTYPTSVNRAPSFLTTSSPNQGRTGNVLKAKTSVGSATAFSGIGSGAPRSSSTRTAVGPSSTSGTTATTRSWSLPPWSVVEGKY